MSLDPARINDNSPEGAALWQLQFDHAPIRAATYRNYTYSARDSAVAVAPTPIYEPDDEHIQE